jgi:hypothetical protein
MQDPPPTRDSEEEGKGTIYIGIVGFGRRMIDDGPWCRLGLLASRIYIARISGVATD